MSKTGTRVGRRASLLAVGAIVAVLTLGGCVSSGGDSYEEFRGAVKAGAPCSELLEQRRNFDERRDLARIDADLAEIGCRVADTEGENR